MKKFLVLILLFFYISLNAFADNLSQIPNVNSIMTNWLKENPNKAIELKKLLSNSQNPTQDFQNWLDKNPESAKQIKERMPTIEVQFKETGNIQYSVFSTTINSVNGVAFKDALAAYLLSQGYNITYANEYQMVVLKNNSFITSTLIGDIKFLFNYSQYGNVIQFIGKGDAGYRMLLFNLMLGVLNQYTGCPVHGKTYK